MGKLEHGQSGPSDKKEELGSGFLSISEARGFYTYVPDVPEQKEDVSFQEWAHSKADLSVSITEVLDRVEDILASSTYRRSGKKYAIEKLMSLIRDHQIHVEMPVSDDGKIGRRLVDAVQEYTRLSYICIKNEWRNIPPTLNSLKATTDLSDLLQQMHLVEFRSYGLNPGPFRITLAEQILPHTAGFIEKTDHLMDPYENRYPDSRSAEEKHQFIAALKENTHFEKIHMQYANALRSLAEAGTTSSRDSSVMYTYEGSTLIDEFYDRSIVPEKSYFSELNHSRILDRHETKAIKKKRGNEQLFMSEKPGGQELYPVFVPAARWVDWPGFSPQQILLPIERYERNLVSCQWDYSSQKMMLTEHEVMGEFLNQYQTHKYYRLRERQGKEQHILQALVFSGSGLKFYNTLDIYSRHPEWLRELNHRVVFMMGIFGGGARDAQLLKEPRNQKVFEKFFRDSVLLFAADQDAEHGIFLLEMMARLRESLPDFQGLYINENLRRTLEDAVLSAAENSYQRKKILCTQLLNAVFDCREEKEEIDPTKAVELIKLNSLQNGVYYTSADYGLFADAESAYMNLMWDFPVSVTESRAFKMALISFLFPDVSSEMMAEMAESMNCSAFPKIYLRDAKGSVRVFNASSGVLSHPSLGAYDPIPLLAVPPDFYEPDQWGKNFSDDTALFLQALCAGELSESPVNLFYLPQDSEEDISNELHVETTEFSFFTQRKSLFLQENREYFCKYSLEQAEDDIKDHIRCCMRFIEDRIRIEGENPEDLDEKMRLMRLSGILKKLNRIRFDNPAHSVWISKSGKFLVLNEKLQVVTRAGEPKRQAYGKTSLLDMDIFVLDPDGREWQVLPAQDSNYDKAVGKIFSDFSRDEARHCISSGSYRIDVPAYGICFEKNNRDDFYHLKGIEDFVVSMGDSPRLPGAVTLENLLDNSLYVLMRDAPPGAQFLDNESRPGDIGYRAGYYFFPLDKNGIPVPKTAQDRLFLVWYFLTQKNTEMALLMIRGLRKTETVDGSPASVRLLYKIITAPPQESAPDVLAIKLQAMLVVAELKVSRRFPPVVSPSFRDKNVFENEILPFFTTFPAGCSTILFLYENYLVNGTFPPACRLGREECRILGMYGEMKQEEVPPASVDAVYADTFQHAADAEAVIHICHEIQRSSDNLCEPVEFSDLVAAWMRNKPEDIAVLLRIDPVSPLVAVILQVIEKTILASLAAMEGEPAYQFMTENRSIAAYEYFFGKRLRADQVAAIKYILTPENKNACLQFIPGGGKTSVFAPVAAVAQADGENLSIVFVPHALLSSNERDINQRTSGAFSARTHTLFFDRSSSATVVDLQRILDILDHVRNTRGFLVLSRETLQSLELRYIELLAGDEGLGADPAAIDVMENILAFFRTYGTALIDELDSVVDIRKEFNYSGGRLCAIDPALIRDTLAIFRHFHPLPVPCLHANIVERLLDCSLMDDFYRHPVDREALRNYFLGHSEIPAGFNDLEKDRLALIKHQAEILLPATAHHELNVSFGFSKENDANFTAIPYICNNVPSENSRFSSPYETLNLTIQAHLSLSIDPRLFKEMVSSFWERHLRSCLMDNLIGQTEAESEYEALTGLSLKACQQALKTGSPSDCMANIAGDKLTEVKYFLLEHFVAPKITFNEYVMHADAISFVDQFRTGAGMTGTVENWRSFHGRMYLEKSPLLYRDIEGEVLGLLEDDKKCISVAVLDVEKITRADIEMTLKDIRQNPLTRAVIDAGALFAGMTSSEVAEYIAADIKNNNPTGIRYVLYYNTDNNLCALSVDDPRKTVILHQTDSNYIDAILGCGAEKRFTYYDQAHTTGSDITQMRDAHALMTVGRNTSRRDLVQATMRMRGINNSEFAQTISILASSAAPLAAADISSVLALCEDNENRKLNEDCMRSLFRQIAGATRNRMMDILTREVATIEEPSLRHAIRKQIFSICKRHFLSAARSPFAMYGHPHRDMTLEEALNTAISRELQLFKDEMEALNRVLENRWNTEGECETLRNGLSEVINARLSRAQKELRVSGSHAETGEQAEVQNQIQTMLELEVERQQQVEYTYTDFTDGQNVKPVVPFNCWHNGHLEEEKCLHSLNDFSPHFDSNIFVTDNYGYIHSNHIPIWDADRELHYQRENIYCLYCLEGGALSCTLLTAEETSFYLGGPTAEHWGSRGAHVWLESLSGNLLLSPPSSKPVGIESDQNYCDIRAQIQFFHGDVDLLLENPHIEWVQNLDEQQREALLDRVLTNPIFFRKKQFYLDNRVKILEHFDPGFRFASEHELAQEGLLNARFVSFIESFMPDMNIWQAHMQVNAFSDVMHAYGERFLQIETMDNERLQERYRNILKNQVIRTEDYFRDIKNISDGELPAEDRERQILERSRRFLRDTETHIPSTVFWQRCKTAAICFVVVLIGAAVGFAAGGPAGSILGMAIAAKMSGVLIGAAAGMVLSAGIVTAINRNHFLAGSNYPERVDFEEKLNTVARGFTRRM